MMMMTGKKAGDKEPRYTGPRMMYRAEGVGYLLDMSGRTIKDWSKDGRFPPPDIDEGNGKFWFHETIEAWRRRKSGKEAA
jgi:hypothetical protein